VAVVVARWWEQFNWISWPDKMMMTVATCLSGKEHMETRRTIARWSSLQSAIAWTQISVRTLKRFPTERHLVESRLMTEEEYDMYTSTNAPHGKWFIPTMWILNLLKQKHREKAIDSVQLDMLLRQVFAFRDGFAMLYVYDWVKIPLVYTQVVAIATYGYFFICLIGRQPKLDMKSMEKEITILFPIFTTFQMLFYVGWLKVGQFLMNPFGEDDDDFELNYVLDRNTCIAEMLASELADQMPALSAGHAFTSSIPHTRASFKIQDIIPKSHLSDYRLTHNDMQLIKPEELEQSNRNRSKRDKKRMNPFTKAGRTKSGDRESIVIPPTVEEEQAPLNTAENSINPITKV